MFQRTYGSYSVSQCISDYVQPQIFPNVSRNIDNTLKTDLFGINSLRKGLTLFRINEQNNALPYQCFCNNVLTGIGEVCRQTLCFSKSAYSTNKVTLSFVSSPELLNLNQDQSWNQLFKYGKLRISFKILDTIRLLLKYVSIPNNAVL